MTKQCPYKAIAVAPVFQEYFRSIKRNEHSIVVKSSVSDASSPIRLNVSIRLRIKKDKATFFIIKTSIHFSLDRSMLIETVLCQEKTYEEVLADTGVEISSGSVNADLGLKNHELQRAALSISLNIAEGAGEYSIDEKIRFYRMTKRSATECAGILDVCQRLQLVEEKRYALGRELLIRLVSMLICTTLFVLAAGFSGILCKKKNPPVALNLFIDN